LSPLWRQTAFFFNQVHELQTLTAHNQEIVQSEIDTIKENSTVMTAAQKKRLEEIRDDVDAKTRAANLAASQAKREALTAVDEQGKKLSQENAQTKQSLAQTAFRPSEANKKAESTNAEACRRWHRCRRCEDRSDQHKADLDKTKSDLKKVSGDLGITNGYVATSAKDIEELKRRGEVNIVEFSLKKEKTMHKVGDIKSAA